MHPSHLAHSVVTQGERNVERVSLLQGRSRNLTHMSAVLWRVTATHMHTQMVCECEPEYSQSWESEGLDYRSD